MLEVKIKKELDNLKSNDLENQEHFVKEVKLLMESNAKEEIDILKTMGLGSNIIKAEEQTRKILSFKEISDKYEGDVYTIDQIKHLALKYNLKFLKTKYFKGHVPGELGSILLRFKEKNVLSQYDLEERFYILGPSKVFNLTKRPVDPLLFYEIKDRNTGETMYKLVHKWGNDFTIFRRISGIINKTRTSVRMSHIIFTFVLLGIINYMMFQLPIYTTNKYVGLGILNIIINVISGLFIIGKIISMTDYDFIENSNDSWDRPYLD